MGDSHNNFVVIKFSKNHAYHNYYCFKSIFVYKHVIILSNNGEEKD